MICSPIYSRTASYSEAVVHKCSVKKAVLRNFVKFTGKRLC